MQKLRDPLQSRKPLVSVLSRQASGGPTCPPLRGAAALDPLLYFPSADSNDYEGLGILSKFPPPLKRAVS